MPGGLNDKRPAAAQGGALDGRAARAQEDATRWLSLLSSGRATEADAQALKRWCRQDPINAEAYAKMSLVWDMLAPVAARAQKDPALSLRVERMEGLGRRAFLGGALAASAGAAGYLLLRPPFGLWPSLAELGADVRTGTGEQRSIVVADGLGVDLNTRSSVSIHAGANGARRIDLISGEAVVSADPKTGPACAIFAAGGRILARNAKVDIRYQDSDVRVACISGSVEVEHGGRAIIVAAAEQVVYGARGMSGIGAADPDAVTAWQKGLLVFRQSPLESVIDEVNRYRPGQIILLNQALGQHLIDARFRLDHLENVITYLRQAFDARIVELPGGVVLVS
ncbi:MAG: FecR domain-containing protein [Pseudomonadota bacterium]